MTQINTNALNVSQNDYLFVDQNGDGIFSTEADSTDFAFCLNGSQNAFQKIRASDPSLQNTIDRFRSLTTLSEPSLDEIRATIEETLPPHLRPLQIREVRVPTSVRDNPPPSARTRPDAFMNSLQIRAGENDFYIHPYRGDRMSPLEQSAKISRALNVENPFTSFHVSSDVETRLSSSGFLKRAQGRYESVNPDGQSGNFFDLWGDAGIYYRSAVYFAPANSNGTHNIEYYEEQSNGSVVHVLIDPVALNATPLPL